MKTETNNTFTIAVSGTFTIAREDMKSLLRTALELAEQAAGTNAAFTETRGLARLFRAMSPAEQRRVEEARTLFHQVQTEMPPLPQDEGRPLANGKIANHAMLFYWMARKEAESLMGQNMAGKP